MQKKQKNHPNKEKISLHTLMAQYPFTKQELEKLHLSQEYSDRLAQMVMEAFKLSQDSIQGQKGIDLLFSKEYEIAKQQIMVPIDGFIISLDSRMTKEVNALEDKNIKYITLLFFLGAIFVIYNIYIFTFF